jgi:hypothetical protein
MSFIVFIIQTHHLIQHPRHCVRGTDEQESPSVVDRVKSGCTVIASHFIVDEQIMNYI